MSIIRVRNDVCSTVWDADNEVFVALTAGLEFDSKDTIVKQFPWAFQTDAQADTERAPRGRKTSARIEQATAEPGEKR